MKAMQYFKKGNILTFGELKRYSEGAVIHILYYDEDGHKRADDFEILSKDSNEEWSAGGYSFPIGTLKEDTLLEEIDNSGWLFTISEAKL